MNISRVISHIKTLLGLHLISLPFKDDITGEVKPISNVLQEVLSVITIPTFSIFQPWIREGTIHMDKLKVVNEKEGIYLLPPFLTMTPVMKVNAIYFPYHVKRSVYADVYPSYGIDMAAHHVAAAQAGLMVTDLIRREPTFEYLGENKIRLYGFPRNEITIKLSCEHDPSGETIPDTCYHSFTQLAILDVKEFLYNNLKMYDKIPTAHGEIDLKLEDYQQAIAEKKELLERWTDTFHLDTEDSFTFM